MLPRPVPFHKVTIVNINGQYLGSIYHRSLQTARFQQRIYEPGFVTQKYEYKVRHHHGYKIREQHHGLEILRFYDWSFQ